MDEELKARLADAVSECNAAIDAVKAAGLTVEIDAYETIIDVAGRRVTRDPHITVNVTQKYGPFW